MIFVYEDLRIYYESIGSGKPLLLLHGWGNDLQTMRSIASLVKQLGYNPISFDMPGFGLSDFPKSSWGVSEYTGFIKKFLDTKGIHQVTLVAHSFGGRVAIKFAVNYPSMVDKLVLIDSAGIKPSRTIKYYLSVYITKFVRLCVNNLPKRVMSNIGECLISRFGSPDYRNAGKMRGTFIKVVNEDLREFLPLINASCLIIWGELDRETPVTDGMIINHLIPNSKFCVIRGAGHHCFVDKFQIFSEIISPFLLLEDKSNISSCNNL